MQQRTIFLGLVLATTSLTYYNAYCMQADDAAAQEQGLIKDLEYKLKQLKIQKGYRLVLDALANDCAVVMNYDDVLGGRDPDYLRFLSDFKGTVQRDLKGNLARENKIDAKTGVEYNALVLRQTEQFLRSHFAQMNENSRKANANFYYGLGSGLPAGFVSGFVTGGAVFGVGALLLLGKYFQGIRVFNP